MKKSKRERTPGVPEGTEALIKGQRIGKRLANPFGGCDIEDRINSETAGNEFGAKMKRFCSASVVSSLGTILLFSGCMGIKPPKLPKMVSYEMVVTERVKRRDLEKENEKLKDALIKQKAAYQELERRIAKAHLQLVKREIQNRDPAGEQDLIRKKLDEAIREVVRTKAKLRSLESKAEAASSLAEAEIALNTMKSAEPDEPKDPGITQAEQLLKMSALEFKDQNYSGALYLTSQAKGLIQMAKERSAIREKIRVEESPASFVLPVSLYVLKQSNVREGPGLDFKVIYTLEKNSKVVGHSYKDQWVRVTTEDGRDGWIFHALLDGR